VSLWRSINCYSITSPMVANKWGGTASPSRPSTAVDASLIEAEGDKHRSIPGAQ
jgi:hypothetical protein